MAERRHRFGLIDLIAVVVSPALVMLMVGSLVFFLVEVLYQGKYTGRMLYTMFFFVFACVLLARLSIQFGRKYAAMYAAALGIVTFIALMAYSSFDGSLKPLTPVINLGLMVLIWWSADKLTWDCTDFDEARKASGRGVLAAAGLDDSAGPPEPEPEPEKPAEAKPKRKKQEDAFIGWVERFKQYRAEQKKKPHTPGVWVLYFSLAALPLFALGQSLIDPADTATRRATFFDMAVYVGSGLALLVTTTLFGLKRYIEERGAHVPPVMTTSWLVMGGALILVFLTVGALLPRPHSETAWFGMDRKGDKAKRQASKNAVVKDSSAGEGEGAEGKKTEAGDGKGSAKGGKEGGGKSGEKGSGGGKGKTDSSKGKSDGGKSKGKNEGNDQKGEQSKGEQEDKKDNGGPNSKADDRSDNEKTEDGEDAKDAEEKSDSGSDSGTSTISKALESIGQFVKWVVWVLVAVAVIVGIVYFVLKGLAPFTNWARNLLDWLKGLFARKPAAQTDREEEAAVAEAVRRTPFSAFDNPFTDGTARHRTPAELVEYTFAAFDAWAWDRDRGREPGETPLEFAVRIGHEWAELDEPAFQTANLYVRVLYSLSPLPADTVKVLKAFWERLEGAAVPA
jgi:hypothetical protein